MSLTHITLRQLEVFQEVVRSGSVTAAAQRLHLTQPTVSIQLRKLSEQIGAKLLEPRQGRLQVTAEGEALFRAAADMLGCIHELEAQVQNIRAGEQGRLSLGIVTTANYVVPRLLGAFGQRFPGIELELNAGNRGEILERFRRQADDLYIFSHPPSLPEVVSARILQNPLVLIAPPDSRWAQQTSLDFTELLQERFLLREPGSGTGMSLQQWLDESGWQLPQSIQIASNEGIFLGVAAGMGLAVVSEHVVRSRQEPVVCLPVRQFPLRGHWYLVRHRERPKTPVAERFITYLERHLAELEPHFVVEGPARFNPMPAEG